MKVILLQDIKGVGKKDDVVNTSDGHARNYLFPKGLAVEATQNNLTKMDRTKAKEEELRKEQLEEARALKEQLDSVKVTISAKTGEGGKLFGTITNKEIAKHLEDEHNISVDKKKITLKNPIKSVGQFNVDVKLHPKVSATLSVDVVAL